jgi:isochorismate pyruvate lyase
MKSPEECHDMAEIRKQVSQVDRDIIALLGKRLEYVKSAVRFKPDEESIRRPDHWDRFFADRRVWAENAGYDPDVIEAMYRTLYDYTIEVQLALHRSTGKD